MFRKKVLLHREVLIGEEKLGTRLKCGKDAGLID